MHSIRCPPRHLSCFGIPLDGTEGAAEFKGEDNDDILFGSTTILHLLNFAIS